MNKLAIYREDKMMLPSRDFVMDVLDQTSLLEMDGYERIKQLKMFQSFQVEAFKMGIILADFDKNENQELILRRFKRLSVNELYYAMKLERYGEYGDKTEHYNRFDTVFISAVLGKYVKWKQNVRITHNLPVGKTAETQTISDQEKKAIIFNGVMECYDYYREHYLIPDGKIYVYDVLYDLGVLPKDKETKKKIYEEAKEVLKTERQLKVLDRELSKQILIEIGKEKSDMVAVTAKKISVGKYFRKIDRKDLIELLKNL